MAGRRASRHRPDPTRDGGGGRPARTHTEGRRNHVAEAAEHGDLTDVTLVGHSWGGYTLTGAAHRIPGRVAEVSWFSAVVPAKGVLTTNELPVPGAGFARAAIAASTDGAVGLPFDLFAQIFVQARRERTQRRATCAPRPSSPGPSGGPSSSRTTRVAILRACPSASSGRTDDPSSDHHPDDR